MPAQYLIRFDDICPTMNWAVWREIEATLVQWDVRPLLAVIPDNQDDTLKRHPPENDFWDHVRRWRDRGWSIGMHGYQHKYVTRNPGIVGINKYSEFAGLPIEVQAAKLHTALEIFHREGIEPDVWIAPAHSFDHTTVALLKEMGLRRISGGFFLVPNVDSLGMLWIPQQLWRFRNMPFGVWTVCLHINNWSPRDALRFRQDVKKNSANIVNLQDIITSYGYRRPDWMDKLFAILYPAFLRLRSRRERITAQATAPSQPKIEQLSDRSPETGSVFPN
jgi:predicted deacetylase